MECLILCAGFATRLRPLSDKTPKHLLPLNGITVLDQVVGQVASAGFSHAVVVTNKMFHTHFTQWRDSISPPLDIIVLNDGADSEKNRLGSVGDLHFALEKLDIQDDFLVIHGDNAFTFSLSPLLDTFVEKGNIAAIYDVGTRDRAKKAGAAIWDFSGRITHFEEKPENPEGTLCSIGIYAFENQIRGLIAAYLRTEPSSDRSGDFIQWLCHRVPIYAHKISADEGEWFDIGTMEEYERARRFFRQVQL